MQTFVDRKKKGQGNINISKDLPLEIMNKWKIFSTKHWSFYMGTPSRDWNLWFLLIKMAHFSSWKVIVAAPGGLERVQRLWEAHRWKEKTKNSWTPSMRTSPACRKRAKLNSPGCLTTKMRQCKKKKIDVFQCLSRCSSSPYVMPLQYTSWESQESDCKCDWQWPRASLTSQMEQGTFTFQRK